MQNVFFFSDKYHAVCQRYDWNFQFKGKVKIIYKKKMFMAHIKKNKQKLSFLGGKGGLKILNLLTYIISTNIIYYTPAIF